MFGTVLVGVPRRGRSPRSSSATRYPQGAMQSRSSRSSAPQMYIDTMYPHLSATQSITATIMLGVAFLCSALALTVALHSQSGFRLGDLVALVQSSSSSSSTDNYKVTCQNIAKSISSSSQVFYPRGSNSSCHHCSSPLTLDL